MFIGHYAIGFAAKKVAPQTSLATLFVAAQWMDFVFPVFVLLGFENFTIEPGITKTIPLNLSHYPFSHSLLASLIWATLLGGVYFIFKKDVKSSLVLGALVVSHWLLDFITHIPDLLLIPGLDIKVGLGLWNSLEGTILVEGGLFLAGIFLYFKSTQAKNRIGSIVLWILIIFFALLYLGNMFGPPPPETKMMIITGFVSWLFIPWAYWIDRNRLSEV